jgi:hypothetical protein
MNRKKVGVVNIFFVILLILSAIVVICIILKERFDIKVQSPPITREYLMTKYHITEE